MKKTKLLKKIIFLSAIIGSNTMTAQTYKFSEANNVEGFVIHTEFSTVEQADMVGTDGVMIFNMPDPSDLVPTSMRVDQSGIIDATNNKFLSIRLQNNTDVTNLRLKIQSTPRAIWSVPITLDTNTSELKTYTLEIKNSEWTGDLSNVFFQFRIPGQRMPITGTSIVIDEISFTPTLSSNDVIKEDVSIKIFPSPVNEQLNVISTNTIEKIEIYNLLGQKVLANKNSKTLNVASLLKGVYIAKIYQEDNLISTKQIIKQ
ncbi:hypothetical protein A8C32_18405 [Flavivirga aquatica]|uniref:Secretion system C-terminal sorting domain-containing protein n=1 Tax=Flavivirga aquatica TaxID=1849968 RepID=A0A1E5T7S5_9FLAO|nr:T9SS type A sorting domain-containing protein [Flavivirga aquatica]OEK07406.1 hypothetical protein A8C32_18405 [Flavivirga aquatica]